MRALVQRVAHGSVTVGDEVVGAIGTGLVVLVGVTHDDTPEHARALARKIGGLRVLRDETSVSDTPGAAVLAVSQFTLYGDVRKGRRPSWSAAAPGGVAEPLFDLVVTTLRDLGIDVKTGVFGADMRVDIVNDGPVTVWIEI